MTKSLEIVNLSGRTINIEDWKVGDKGLAIKLAAWLTDHLQHVIAIETTDDGVILIHYEPNLPAIRIEAGKLIWPKGSDFNLMMSFLES